MDRETVTRLAREAGYVVSAYRPENGETYHFVHTFSSFHAVSSSCLAELERFAALVAQAEREACAAICDAEADEFGGASDGFYASKNCATAIRARGNHEN